MRVIKLILALSFLFAYDFVWAKSPGLNIVGKKEKSIVPIEWYRPESYSVAGKRKHRVIFLGKAPVGSKVELDSKEIPVLVAKTKEVIYFESKEAYVAGDHAISNKDGYFLFELELPYGLVQVPLKITFPDSSREPEHYQMGIRTSKYSAVAVNQNKLKRSPLFDRRYGFWFGLGLNYVKYTQDTDILSSPLVFKTFRGPSYYFKNWYNFNDVWQSIASLKISPGRASGSSEVSIKQGNYNWLIFSGEGLYFPDSWRYILLGRSISKSGVRFGLQHHIVPFINRTGVSATDAEILTNTISLLTLGGHTETYITRKVMLEMFLRYQIPIANGNTFSMTPSFAFDGSIGAIYKPESMSKWSYGLFWYGQWHSYDVEFEDPIVGSLKGSQDLFFTNIDVRASYMF